MSPGNPSGQPKALSTKATPPKSSHNMLTMAESPASSRGSMLGRRGTNRCHEDIESNMKDIQLCDESGIEVKASPTGRYSTSPESKSAGPMSPGTRYGSFVQHGIQARHEDPFMSTYKPPHRRLPRSPLAYETPTGSRINPRHQTNWRSDSGSGSGGGSAKSYSSKKSHDQPGQDNPVATYPQDVLAGISSENAQSHLPPGACVFVANLSSAEDEQELEAGVLQVFREYGIVFVKIRRDSKNMPFAFCQYATEEEALTAIAEGKGKLIHGRPCRTERAKVHRTFYISKRDGSVLLIEEGEAALVRHGLVVAHSWYPDQQTKLLHNLAGGFFVQLKFYDDNRQAQQAIRNEGIYQFEPTNNIFDSPVRSLVVRNPTQNQRAVDYIREYEHDRNSIFVSNLPEGFTESDFRMLFSPFGVIVSAVLFHRPSQRNIDQMYLYGFIEYQEPFAARRAIEAKNTTSVGGCIIRVAHKNSDRNTRGRPRSSVVTRSSPLRTPQAVRQIDASPSNFPSPSYPPTPYGWMGFSPPPYASPYSGYWSNSPQYVTSPYPVPYGGSPSPNPNPFYPGYGYPADVYNQYYGLPYWASPGANIQTASTMEPPTASPASGDQPETFTEDPPADSQ